MTIEVLEKRVWMALEQYKAGKLSKSTVNRWLKQLNKVCPERCTELRKKAYSIIF